MATRKVKSAAKIFTSDQNKLKRIVSHTANRVEGIVGSSLGPGGKITAIESDLPGIPNVNTKDGVTIFRALGASDPYEHLIIEQWRDVAIKVNNEAGDGPQPLDSKVLTPTGFIEMGDVEVGMDICGTNSTVQKVLGVYPKGQKEICKVQFADGAIVKCCEDHLWTTINSDGKKETKPLKMMLDGEIRYVENTLVDFNEIESEITILPYFLGKDLAERNSEIPSCYLYSSLETRLSVFEGILDNHKAIGIDENDLFILFTPSPSFANSFVELCRGLGKEVSISKDNEDFYRIQELKGYKYGRKIVNILKTGEQVEMQCIKVSNDNHLYITDNYIPTHNTTTATILSAALINNLFNFCENHKKYSPQRGTRVLQKLLNEKMIPFIEKQSIKVGNKNKNLLKQVAQVSANGDGPMADAVIEAFESVGYGSSSHVTIQQLSGPNGFEVELIEGFPIPRGYEESIGKFHNAFINDQGNQRCILEKPLFVLFDGNLTDLVQFGSVLENIGEEYANGNSEFANVVLVAHGFSEKVLTTLSFNFANPSTINVVPLKTPVDAIINSELNFLLDLSAFTGAKIFDMNNPLVEATPDDFGSDMERIEIYRFRTTVVGEPDPLNVESRAEELSARVENAESKIEKSILEERLGKLTNGIARLKIFGSSNGDLKEMADRAEDAVCAVRAAIKHGCLPGGCRVLIDLALELQKEKENKEIINEVLVPSLLRPFHRLLSNAGYLEDEIEENLQELINDKKKVLNVETGEVSDVKKLGIYDATLAVKQALVNAISISKVIGTIGGIIVHPRYDEAERTESSEEIEFQKDMANPQRHKNEANERP